MVTFVTQRTVLCFVIIEYAKKLCADHNNNINKINDINNNNKDNRTFVNFVRPSGQPILLGHQESTLSITIVTYGVQTSDKLGCCGYV